MKIGERKVSGTSSSLVIALPAWLARTWNVAKGDYLTLELENEKILKITPGNGGREAKDARK